MSYSAANMSDEARAYYAGGRRAVIAGVPCRVAAHAVKAPGRDNIAKLVASAAAIQPGDLPDAPRFSFTPAEAAPLYNGKPSARGNAPAPRARIKSSWWKPATLSLAPYSCLSLTETDYEESQAKGAWAEGDPKPLRKWLAETADERRATWAAIDACNAVAAFAKALGSPLNFEQRKAAARYIALCDDFAARGFERPAPPRGLERLAA